MIYTSYFDKIQIFKGQGFKNFISVAGKTPDNLNIKKFFKLMPKYNWWKYWYDNNLSNEYYEDQYFKTVLNKLNVNDVVKELGSDPILLCYEKPNEFCHRHLIAKWLKGYNFDVEEI